MKYLQHIQPLAESSGLAFPMIAPDGWPQSARIPESGPALLFGNRARPEYAIM